jgi:hypothetical protein
MPKDIELIVFSVGFAGLLNSSWFIFPKVLDHWELLIQLFVVTPFLAWGGRLIMKGKI